MQPAPPGPLLRVLVVDDNRDIADSTAELMRVVGFEVVACYGGLAALDVAAAFQPDVCLVDLNMPGMDGDELGRQIRDRAGGRPVVLVALTAMDDAGSRRRTSDAGFRLHLVKPVNPHDLVRVVDELWRTWEAEWPPPSSK
jgi:two-component system, OmpR family, response regulator